MGFFISDESQSATACTPASHSRLCHSKTAWGPIFIWVLSTKYTDSESGLVYYGYRYYQTEIGMWASRDPIADLAFRRHGRQGLHLVSKYNINPVSVAANPYRFLQNKPIVTVDPLGLFGISSDKGPSGLACGGFTWTVKFDFDADEKWGFVVQHVSSWKFHMHACPPSKTEMTYNEVRPYWELWQVSAGQTYDPKKKKTGDWFYKKKRDECDTGTVEIEAEATFYPRDEGGENTIPDGFTVNGVENAGGLYSTYTEPDIWSETGYERKSHKLSIKWDCCQGAKDSTIVSHTP